MSAARKREPYTAPTCGNCGRRVVWIARADGAGRRPYEPKPVTPAEVRVGVIAHPVFGGQAWWPADLATHFMQIHGYSRTDAEAEVRDVDWHRPHDCNSAPERINQPTIEGAHA